MKFLDLYSTFPTEDWRLASPTPLPRVAGRGCSFSKSQAKRRFLLWTRWPSDPTNAWSIDPPRQGAARCPWRFYFPHFNSNFDNLIKALTMNECEEQSALGASLFKKILIIVKCWSNLIRLLESFIGLQTNKNHKITTVLGSFLSQKLAKSLRQKPHQHRQ